MADFKISDITTSVTAMADADILEVEQSAVSKKVTWATIKADVWTALGALIAGGATKATPVDGDLLPLSDSAASNATKYLSWANLKATLATYIATLGYATTSYVDTTVNARSWKNAVRAATTSANTLATDFENGDTIDGVVLATGDRVLVKDQASGAENGIYTINASGAPTRAVDADAGSELVNATVAVSEGTTNADRQYTCTTDAPITLGSTSLTWTQTGTGGGGGITALTGDVTASGTGSVAATIANDAVTYAKMQNVSATDKVLGRVTAGAGDVEEISTTGSGNVVRATSPTLVTPALGTPASGNLSSCTADGTTAVGFLGIPQNSQSAAYTLVAADAGKHIYHPAADTTARIWTIPANASVAFPIGTAVTFDNDFGAGALTIAITTDTLVLVGTAGSTGSRTIASGGQATAVKVTSTRWRISGTGLS